MLAGKPFGQFVAAPRLAILDALRVTIVLSVFFQTDPHRTAREVVNELFAAKPPPIEAVAKLIGSSCTRTRTKSLPVECVPSRIKRDTIYFADRTYQSPMRERGPLGNFAQR